MPPRRREEKSMAPSPSPALRSSRSRSQMSEVEALPEPVLPVTEESAEEEEESAADDNDDEVEADETDGPAEAEAPAKPSIEDRKAKLKELRLRMNQSAADNRKDLVADHQKAKVTAKEVQRLEKQRKLAHTLRLKADAEASGEDLERRKAWEWSIEQNERWEKKLSEQAERSDTNFHNAEDDAFKKYNKNVRTTKPDLVAYSRQKEAALGLAPGTLAPIGATSDQIAAAGPGPSSAARGLTAAEDLYRGADTLAYGDSKPSDDAIDRVISKINKDIGGKKKRKDDDEGGDVTYINERNKVFNKKIARYFDKYTKEIKASLERGTAL